MYASVFLKWASAAMALALPLVLAAACSSDKTETPATAAAEAGPDGSGSGDASASLDADGAVACILPGSYGSRSCNACMQSTCCDVIGSCEGEATCKPLQKCVVDCLNVPDAGGCRTGCLAQYPDGKSTWLKVEACWFNDPPKCGVACT